MVRGVREWECQSKESEEVRSAVARKRGGVLEEGRGAKELGWAPCTGSHVHAWQVQTAVITEGSHKNSLSLFR